MHPLCVQIRVRDLASLADERHLVSLARMNAFPPTRPLVPPHVRQLPRAYPYDGLVKELSGTDDPQFAVSRSSSPIRILLDADF